LQISLRDRDEIKIVAIEGNLDTTTAPDAESCLNELVNDGSTKILVDFTAVDYISSAGLRVLLATAKKMQAVGGSLRMCGLNEAVQEVFDISGFSTIFNLHGEENDALAAF
jgi:anti-sigma B factor antagonist